MEYRRYRQGKILDLSGCPLYLSNTAEDALDGEIDGETGA